MDYKVLARKWRPKVFAEVAGQKPVVQTLQYALKAGKVHHAYLFTGTRGVGKTTIARILAKALSCELGVSAEPCNTCTNCKAIDEGQYIDVLEIDAASRTKVEDTRELLDNVPYAPVQGRYKIYIIDEVHMLSNHSFNALLKTLEEPPEHVKFLFATTDPHKLPITILSRCMQFQLSIFDSDEIVTYLQNILTAEHIKFELPALQKISSTANGSMRDALTLLEQVIALGEGEITNQVVLKNLGIANNDLLLELLIAVMDGKPQTAFTIIKQLQQEAIDFKKVLQELLAILHKIAIAQVLPNYIEDNDLAKNKLLELSKRVAPEDIQLFYQIAMHGNKDLMYAPDLKLGFEMIILRMLAFQPVYITSDFAESNTLQQQPVAIDPGLTKPAQQGNLSVPELPTLPTAEIITTNSQIHKQEHNHNHAYDSDSKPDRAGHEYAHNHEHEHAHNNNDKIAIHNHNHNHDNDHDSDSKPDGAGMHEHDHTHEQHHDQNHAHDSDSKPDWAEMIYEMKLTGLTKVVAQHCTITSWKPGKVVLTLDPVHKSLLQQHHEQRLQDALQKYLHRAIGLKINIGQVVDETPAAKYKHKQAKIQQEAENLVKEDQLVKEILQTFNAKLERVIVKDEA